jgi:twitching motility protein PilT
MSAIKLLSALSRAEVKEVSLQVGEPARALIGSVYRRLTPQALTEDNIIALLAAMNGREHLLGLNDGCSWMHECSVGIVAIHAGYEGRVLKASLRLASEQPQAAAPVRSRSRRPPAPIDSRRESAPIAERISPVPARRPSKRPPAAEPSRASMPAMPRASNSGAARGAIQPPPNEMEAAAAAVASIPSPRGSKRPPPLRAQTEALPRVSQPFEAPLPVRSAAPPPEPLPEADEPAMSLSEAFDFQPRARPRFEMPVAEAQAAPPRRELPKFEGDALDDLFGKAREHRASDLHVLADRPPMLRIAGELVQQDYLVTGEQAEQLILARVPDAARAGLDRDGSCDFALEHPAYGRFRANVTRQRTGIKLTARPIGDHIPTLEELGLPESIGRATEHHQGLILVTGPTGHGKTTTLNAIVGIINRERRHHVITVEDPVEYVHPTARAVISQREVGTHTKSFAAALKGSLREDPDVIVVGELRDTETVRMALSASETGHLVISTMNTPSAAKAIERMIDLFPPGDQPQVRMTLAGGLRLIVSQRLLPNTDRTALVAAAEILPGNMPLWNLIRENRTYQIASLQQRGKKMGIVRLDESLAQLVRSGRTTIDIAKPLAEQPEHFDAFVAGRSIIQAPVEAPVAPNAAMRATNQAVKAGAVAAAASSKKAADIGKSMLSRAGKLFGNEG